MSVASDTPVLQSNTTLATAGYYQLSWQHDIGSNYELQESTVADFSVAQTLYTGMDTASVISGKPDGIYYYRLRINNPQSAWSEPVAVTVKHHPIERAFVFFTLGVVIFILVLVTVLRGNKAA